MPHMLLLLAIAQVAAAGLAVPPPNPEALIEGDWEGTERCAEHCCTPSSSDPPVFFVHFNWVRCW